MSLNKKTNKHELLPLTSAKVKIKFKTPSDHKRRSGKTNKLLQKKSSDLFFYRYFTPSLNTDVSVEVVSYGKDNATIIMTVALYTGTLKPRGYQGKRLNISYTVDQSDLYTTMSSYIKNLVALKKLALLLEKDRIIPDVFRYKDTELKITLRDDHYAPSRKNRISDEQIRALRFGIKELSKDLNTTFTELNIHKDESHFNRHKRIVAGNRTSNGKKVQG